jgi:hypothetical protein
VFLNNTPLRATFPVFSSATGTINLSCFLAVIGPGTIMFNETGLLKLLPPPPPVDVSKLI